MKIWSLTYGALTTPIADLGLSLVSGSFQAHGPCSIKLELAADFDAPELLAYGAAVTLSFTEGGIPTVFFQGQVRSIPKYASGSEEGQIYEIADAWADLENTIYQEDWGVGAGTVLMPRFVYGMDEEGTRITVGEQIRRVITYAATAGVDIAVGTIPDGEMPIPSEVANSTVSEIIGMCLKLHPDWIPWLDHSVTPPAFNVSDLAGEFTTAPTVSFTLDGTGDVEDFQITKRDDLLPESVRIVYEYTTSIEEEVYRNVSIDKWPLDGPDSGAKVLQAHVPLAGTQAQIQKSRIQTQDIPVNDEDPIAKDWLKIHHPPLAAVANANFQLWALSQVIIPEAAAYPDPINPQAPRQVVTNPAEVPRELVRGTIEDWMLRKTATMEVEAFLRPQPGATEAEKKIFGTQEFLRLKIRVNATNAQTKIYKGVSSWIAPENVPTGIAQATYEAIHAAVTYQGKITLTVADIPTFTYLGSRLNLTAGVAGWATMKAPIHSMDWDIQNGTMTLSFGPVPHLAPTDFLEMQRILRYKPTRWWSAEERASNRHGATNNPSAKGDTVSGFEGPTQKTWIDGFTAAEQFEILRLIETDGTWTCRVKQGYVLTIDPEPGTVMGYIPVTGCDTTEHTVTAYSKIYCKVTTAKDDLATAAEIIVASSAPTDLHAQPDPGGTEDPPGTYHYLLADFETEGDEIVVKTQYHKGGPITHRPARNNRNLDLIIHSFEQDSSSGNLVPSATTYPDYSTPKILSWRQGVFVGLDAGDAPANLIVVNAMTLDSLRVSDLPTP